MFTFVYFEQLLAQEFPSGLIKFYLILCLYFDSTFVNLLVYFYYSVDFSIVYCTVLLCNLTQEFPSGLIKFYLILSYLMFMLCPCPQSAGVNLV